MVFCTWVCMHKTIGLNHGFVHTVLYVCFLCKTEYKMKIHKIKAYDNSSSGKLIVSYLGGTRFKTLVEPLCIQKNISRPMFYIYKCLCNGQLSSHYMCAYCTFLIFPVPRNFHAVAENLHDTATMSPSSTTNRATRGSS